ncbi:hypothetical protein ABPG77_005459 [Micractinium sp. CCAP 211/92]
MAPSSLLRLPCALLLLAAAVAAGSSSSDGGNWQKGRATYYGLDGWSIHKGACGLGYQYKNLGTGWDVAAIADASPEFAGSCGRCYEVRCDPRSQVIDGYGNPYDRSSACKAGSASVVVRTVDNCPCNYPANPYSNKRWCCGDHADTQGTHFDLSLWAFEKLADLKNGMMGIQWRRVPCSYRPSDPAPDGPTGMPGSEQPKALGYPGDAYSPGTGLTGEQLVVRFDDAGAKQGAVRPMESYDKGAGVKVVTRGELLAERGGGSSASASASASAGSSGSAAPAPSSSDNGCTDTPPTGSSCAQQKSNKQCDQPWMMAGNYCRATCGRCKMASPPPSQSSAPSSGSSCDDITPPGQPGCSQQKAWGNCAQGWMAQGGYCAATCGRCSGSGSSSAAAQSSSSSGSGCDDITPPGQAGCSQQKAWGNCAQGWMAQGGYCAATCGRCSGSSGSSAAAQSSSSSGSSCNDITPPGQAGCSQQKAWGNCAQGWMAQGGYCAATCGRCSGSGSSSAAAQSSSSSSSGCSDVTPPGQATCSQQKAWGNCAQGWMSQWGYCAATCGRCSGTGGSSATAQSSASSSAGVSAQASASASASASSSSG